MHHRAARVVQWSAADLEETSRLRALLEGEAAGLAAQRASHEDVAAMAEAQARYERSIADGTPTVERAGCNDAFHAAVLAASGSTRLPVLLAVITSAPPCGPAPSAATPPTTSSAACCSTGTC